jgi:formylglycine-generating enzyme required for sulfatase activity
LTHRSEPALSAGLTAAPQAFLVSDRPAAAQQKTTLGVYDLVGNVRDWCYNEAGEGERATVFS